MPVIRFSWTVLGERFGGTFELVRMSTYKVCDGTFDVATHMKKNNKIK